MLRFPCFCRFIMIYLSIYRLIYVIIFAFIHRNVYLSLSIFECMSNLERLDAFQGMIKQLATVCPKIGGPKTFHSCWFCKEYYVGGIHMWNHFWLHFSIIYGIILPIDEYVSRWLKPPTRFARFLTIPMLLFGNSWSSAFSPSRPSSWISEVEEHGFIRKPASW